MDLKWNNGYKNDVWSMQGTDWTVKGDIRVRNGYHQKLPKTTSQLKWKQLTPGILPKPGQTYDNFLICQPFFANVVRTNCTVYFYSVIVCFQLFLFYVLLAFCRIIVFLALNF